MILLWGIPSEPPVALAVAAARQLGLDHAVVNQRRAAEDDIVLDAAGGGRLRLDSVTIDLAEVTGVYVRIMDPHALPEARAGTAGGRDRSEAFHSMLLAWADTTDGRVANPTDAMASNGSTYAAGAWLSEAGAIACADMTLMAAFSKLMLLLAGADFHGWSQAVVKQLMQQNLLGEMRKDPHAGPHKNG